MCILPFDLLARRSAQIGSILERLEQMMQIYHVIFLAGLSVTLLLTAVTAALTIRWRIWEAAGILSGKKAMKAVQTGQIKKAVKKSPVKEGTTERLWYRKAQSVNTTVMLQQNHQGTVLLNGNAGSNFGKTEHLDEKVTSGMFGLRILEEIILVHSRERC